MIHKSFSSYDSRKISELVVKFTNEKQGKFYDEFYIHKIVNPNNILSGQTISKINLSNIESKLKQEEYIEDAQIYLNRMNQLQVDIKQKVPIYRVFTPKTSFYITDKWTCVSINNKFFKRLVTIYGPLDNLGSQNDLKQKLILNQLQSLHKETSNHQLLQSTIDQIYVNNQGKISIKLTFLDPIIELGYIAHDIKSKINKLHIFLNKTMNRLDLNQYTHINIAFTNQIIGKLNSKNHE
jgi:cell division protein FtsQ